MRARLFVPSGTPSQASGGDMSAPSQPYLRRNWRAGFEGGRGERQSQGCISSFQGQNTRPECQDQSKPRGTRSNARHTLAQPNSPAKNRREASPCGEAARRASVFLSAGRCALRLRSCLNWHRRLAVPGFPPPDALARRLGRRSSAPAPAPSRLVHELRRRIRAQLLLNLRPCCLFLLHHVSVPSPTLGSLVSNDIQVIVKKGND